MLWYQLTSESASWRVVLKMHSSDYITIIPALEFHAKILKFAGVKQCKI